MLSPVSSQHSVYIILSVFHPDRAFLAQQLTSLAAQTHKSFHLHVVIADTSSADLVEELAREAGLNARLIEPETRLDAVRAFEAGLSHAVEAAAKDDTEQEPLFAFCDQDDVWHKNRLSRGIVALQQEKTDLAHSDARLVNASGDVLQNSMFAFEKRQKKPSLRGLLYRNNITGMTALFTARAARAALPFPRQSGVHFYHDLWLGLIAASLGGVSFINEALVDYRQHDQNVVGAVDRKTAAGKGIFVRLKNLIDPMWLRREATSFALARFLAIEVTYRIEQLSTAGLLAKDVGDCKALRPYSRMIRGIPVLLWDSLRLAASGHPGVARLAAGHAIVAAGRAVWFTKFALTQGIPYGAKRFDRRLFQLAPGVEPSALEASAKSDTFSKTKYQEYVDPRKQPKWEPVFDAPHPVLNILVPTLNPTETFAGILTAVDIGLGLAERGCHVRFITTDLPIASFDASQALVLGRLSGEAVNKNAKDRISLACSIQNPQLSSHKDDRFLATAWWSAHVADQMIRTYEFTHSDFYYLIQDFEPNFYSWGQEYADAMGSYGLKFTPIFNTTLLRRYFHDQGFSFATPEALAFHPSISLDQYSLRGRDARGSGPVRLALYGRPEVDRNMFSTAVHALSIFLEAEELAPEDIEFLSVGLKHAPITLPNGHVLQSLGKLPLQDYPDFLLKTDIGLSLMYSPHPSHPPLEMAASGVRVVTNGFGPKDLSEISPAILSADPTPEALADALSTAWKLRDTPVADNERNIDLSLLGLEIEMMIDRLSQDFLPEPATVE